MNLQEMKQNTGTYIMRFSLPAIISMLVSALITITDGFFIGNYSGADALAAVNIGLPVVYLLIACGLMIGVGGSAIGGIANGNGDTQGSRKIFSQTVLTAFLISAVISCALFLLMSPVGHFLGAEGTTHTLFCAYFKRMVIYYPFMVTTTVLGMFLRAEGKPMVDMIITLISVAINILLDALSVSLHLGIEGIAYASILAGFIGCLLSVCFFFTSAKVFRFTTFRFQKDVFKNTVCNGSSEFVGEMASCISMFCYNRIILQLTGEAGIAAFTIAGYTIFLFSMIALGFGQGMCALVSYSYGARETALARNILRKTNIIVFLTGIVFSILLIAFADAYSRIFIHEPAINQMVKEGIHILSVSFCLMGYNILGSMYFTSCGKAAPSALISIARGIVILLIMIFILPTLFGMTGVWMAAPATEVLSCALTLCFLCKNDKKERNIA